MYLGNSELMECSKLPQGRFHSLDLNQYVITESEAEKFFNIMKLVPLLTSLVDDPNTKLALFELINITITQPTDNKTKFLGFATAIGCDKMRDFLLATYF